jgi:hypothetical protein
MKVMYTVFCFRIVFFAINNVAQIVVQQSNNVCAIIMYMYFIIFSVNEVPQVAGTLFRNTCTL